MPRLGYYTAVGGCKHPYLELVGLPRCLAGSYSHQTMDVYVAHGLATVATTH